ncbi:MAG TPA: hypothetical protein VGQ22_12570 [Steroidobacteraceae bacterium]|nr:hypothetical protein [Steroidobacteraceae bacterium]
MSDRVSEVAAAIVRHLEEHPNAADTEEGIRSWWLEPGSASAADVSGALERLIRAGSVERVQIGTRVVFRAHRAISR